ncbi:MAG TPA: hypothetical protein VEC35_09345 [Noviherbaspirillum sp.]|nr:hypothetical protein [Noviherbaspirillum sp.]
MDIAIPLLSAIVGFIGGLLTPWIKWKIREQEQRLVYRREQIKVWRAAISDYEVWDNGFGNTPEYASLRAHMRPDVIKQYESDSTLFVPGGRGEDVRKHMLLDEIARIEKSWSLV